MTGFIEATSGQFCAFLPRCPHRRHAASIVTEKTSGTACPERNHAVAGRKGIPLALNNEFPRCCTILAALRWTVFIEFTAFVDETMPILCSSLICRTSRFPMIPYHSDFYHKIPILFLYNSLLTPNALWFWRLWPVESNDSCHFLLMISDSD